MSEMEHLPSPSGTPELQSDRLWCYICDSESCICPALRLHGRYGLTNLDVFGLLGLQNVGNSCYMNSALHALANIPPLADYFIYCSSDYKKGLRNTDYSECTFIKNFREFLIEFWLTRGRNQLSTLPLSRIRQGLDFCNSYREEDSQEFLTCFLLTLRSELSYSKDYYEMKVRTKPKFMQMSYGEIKRYADQLKSNDGPIRTNDGYILTGSNFDDTPSDEEPLEQNRNRCCASTYGLEDDLIMEFIEKNPIRTKTEPTSILTDLFAGTFACSIQCFGCRKNSHRIEVFHELSLPIPEMDIPSRVLNSELGAKVSNAIKNVDNIITEVNLYGFLPGLMNFFLVPQMQDWLDSVTSAVRFWWLGSNLTLYDCLDAYFQVSHLRNSDKYNCETCRGLRNAESKSKIMELPEVLNIHIKRMQKTEACQKHIAFPIDDLDMKRYLHPDCKSKVWKYKLMCIITHTGNGRGNSGHFKCYARNKFNNEWYLYDDSNVFKVNEESVMECDAYMLFYKKDDEEMRMMRSRISDAIVNCSQHPIKFAVSVKWLFKYNTFADPGYIDNTDFLCLHGHIKSECQKYGGQLYKPVSKPVWDTLYKKFQGGPVCRIDELEVCSRCPPDPQNVIMEPVKLYAVSEKWLLKWVAYNNRGSGFPNVTDNSDLDQNNPRLKWFDNNNMKREFPTVIDNSELDRNNPRNCIFMTEDLFSVLYEVYGGGPLMTKNMDQNPYFPINAIEGEFDDNTDLCSFSFKTMWLFNTKQNHVDMEDIIFARCQILYILIELAYSRNRNRRAHNKFTRSSNPETPSTSSSSGFAHTEDDGFAHTEDEDVESLAKSLNRSLKRKSASESSDH